MSLAARVNWTGLSVVMLSSVAASSVSGFVVACLASYDILTGTTADLVVAPASAALTTLAGSLALRHAAARRIATAFAGGVVVYLVCEGLFPLSALLGPLASAGPGAAFGFLFGAGLDRLLTLLFPGRGGTRGPETLLHWLFAVLAAIGAFVWAGSLYYAGLRGHREIDDLLWLGFLTCAVVQGLVVSFLLGFRRVR